MIGAIVLAAGKSSRMGTQKLLLPLGDGTVISTVVDQILRATSAGIEEVIVVVSSHAGTGDAIAKALADRPIVLIENPDPNAEMLSSVRCGLQALPGDCSAAIVALGDQPSISAELIDDLVAAFRTSGTGIVVPTHAGKRGHPLLLAARYFAEVQASHNGVGLRGLLDAHPTDILELVSTNPAVLDDIDVPADYQRALRKHSSHTSPRGQHC
jgi:molybdenum cofactor cytidylyltransferase